VTTADAKKTSVSVRTEATAGETGGLRWLYVALPRPGATKNELTFTYCKYCNERRDAEKQGREPPTWAWQKPTRFMLPEAREFRRLVVETVQPALVTAGLDYKAGFFREGRPWGGTLLHYFNEAYDFDHFISHLTDSVVEAKLAKHDRACRGIVPWKMTGGEGTPDLMYLWLTEGWP